MVVNSLVGVGTLGPAVTPQVCVHWVPPGDKMD